MDMSSVTRTRGHGNRSAAAVWDRSECGEGRVCICGECGRRDAGENSEGHAEHHPDDQCPHQPQCSRAARGQGMRAAAKVICWLLWCNNMQGWPMLVFFTALGATYLALVASRMQLTEKRNLRMAVYADHGVNAEALEALRRIGGVWTVRQLKVDKWGAGPRILALVTAVVNLHVC